MIATTAEHYAGAAVPLPRLGTIGAFPARELENPYRGALSLLRESTMQQALANKLATSYTRPKIFHALGMGDLPILIGGGVFAMILSDIFSVSPLLQWTSIGAVILVGLFLSIVDFTNPATPPVTTR